MGMKTRWATQRWQQQAVILGTVLILLSGALCVFGVGHAMADDLSPDLCVSMFAVTLTVLLLPGPLMSGRALCEFWFRLSVAPLRSLDRPPKLAPLS